MHAPRRGRTATSSALLAAIVCAVGCSAVPRHRADTGPLRVGTSGDYAPFSVRGADGGYSGFDPTVARAYAAARGRPLVLVPFRWPELATRLAAGEFDVAMSGVTVRGDRLLTGTMTAAVARADAVVLVRHGAPPRPTYDDPRVRVAVNRGGHLERVARARLPHATLVTVDDNRSLPVLLRERRVDALVTDTLEAGTYDAGAFAVAARLARDRKAYWVAPGRDALAEDLDAWLLARERDGTLERWRVAELRQPAASARPLPPEMARVVDLAARRLLVMPAVAAAKRAAGLPIVDEARERAVIARAVERARTGALDADAARRLAEAQIAAARAVQEAATASTAPVEAPALATLRTAIDGLDAALLRALVAARAARPTDPDVATVRRSALAAALRADAELPGFDEAHAGAVAAALAAIVAAP
jgi:cyclohexadienyl dehydratase